MASATNGANTITYGYDANGLRHTKTVDGVEYKYYYAGDKLVRETFGSNVIDFFYDPDGRPYAMKYNGLILYYVLNQQGDVVRLIDSEGVNYGSYKYDAWGNILQMPSTNYIKNNPLRYRGYVYDPETELYYCQSRYYDPKIGRFLNADSLVSTGQGIIGNNMFAYCNNNPVMYEDASGCSLKPSTTYINDGGYTYSDDEDLLSIWEYITNEDESVVLNAKYLAFYKGALVIKLTFLDNSGFSFGVIGLGPNVDVATVRHEYGHFVHLRLIGPANYVSKVAVPSLFDFFMNVPYDKYYSEPQEYIADILGGVERTWKSNPYQYSITPLEALWYFIYSIIP